MIGWGSNSNYVLGIGTAPGTGIIWPPVLAATNYTFTQIADIRLSPTPCAYNSSGSLYCWGSK